MIERAAPQNIHTALFENEPFNVAGRLVPRFENGVWSFTEQLFDAAFQKTYEDDFSLSDYLDFLSRPKRAVLLFLDEEGVCLGRARVRANWNRYAFLEDIAVRASMRKKGVGTALFHAVCAWAKEEGLCGVTLETQDMNLNACRFYQKMGMALGCADTCLYANFPETKNELALFWYLRF